MVLGVLRQVAVLAGLGDLADDGGPLDALELLELDLERGGAGGGQRDLLHGGTSFGAGIGPMRSRHQARRPRDCKPGDAVRRREP